MTTAPTAPPLDARDLGPFSLRGGDATAALSTLPADAELLFRFEARDRRVYVATATGEADLVLDLLDGGGHPLHSDDGSGLDGDPLIAAPLEPGIYHLRVRGMTPEASGPFRVRVVAV